MLLSQSNTNHKNIHNVILILFLIFTLPSCTSKAEQLNKDFLQKYGKEVKRITNKRSGINQSKKAICPPQGCTPKDNKLGGSVNKFGTENQGTYRPSGVNNSSINLPQTKSQYSPNMGALPRHMFYISYLKKNSPHSYGSQKISFDDVNIPMQDAFGIDTNLGTKNYQLIDGLILQKNIELTNKSRLKEENEISLEIIREEKINRRKKPPEIVKEEIIFNNKPKTIKSDNKENTDKKSNLITNKIKDGMSKTSNK